MATKDFITYSPNSGNGTKSISVTASKNTTSTARSTSLSISGKGITKTINISQKKGAKSYIVVGGVNTGQIFKIQLQI